VYRLVLATLILLSAAIGIILGAWLVIDLSHLTDATSDFVSLTLWLNIILAGIAACGFGAFFNSPWRMLWISVVCGMVGHAVRYLCLASDFGQAGSTLLACTAIGLLAGVAARHRQLPFSSVAFAGAVPMMPGSMVYRSIAAAFRLISAGGKPDPELVTTGAVYMLQALCVVGAMAIGLLLGSKLALLGETAIQQMRRKKVIGESVSMESAAP